jgi:TolB-like protein/Tfp pilus assembly protein PilF
LINLRNLLNEVGRRRVARVAVVYAAVAFALLEAADIVIPALGLADWTIRWVIALALLGFPLTLLLAWVYDLTPRGVVRTKPLEEEGIEVRRRAETGRPFVSAVLLLASGAMVAWAAFFAYQWSIGDSLSSSPSGVADLESLDPQRIAVLPFDDLNNTESGEVFANAIHEDILHHLAKIDSLEVISRTTLLQYKDTPMSAGEIGAELNAGSILEGSVRQQGDSIRVVTQLIDARSDRHLWTETFDRGTTNVFQVQSEIAQEIARALQVELTTEDLRELEAVPMVSGEAYEKYADAKAQWELRGNRVNALRAVQLFQEATELDPNFARGFAALSQARMWLFWNFPGAQGQALLAREALDRAIELAPNTVETRLAQGYFFFYGEGDSREALRLFREAEALKPSDADVITAIGLIHRGQGRWEEAVATFERARSLDYGSYNLIYTLGETYLRMRRFGEAERYLQLATTLAPEVTAAHRDLLRAKLASTADTVQARLYLEALPESTPAPVLSLLEADLAYYRGDYQRALDGPDPGRISRTGREIPGALPQTARPQGQGFPTTRLRSEGTRPGLGTVHERLALLYHLMGDEERRDIYADSLRMSSQADLEAATETNGGAVQNRVIARAQAKLGIAYALLGDSFGAVAEGSKAAYRLSIADDAYDGANHLRDLVLIYTLVGAPDQAIQQFQTALSVPSPLTVADLALDPLFAPLRDHPGAAELLAAVQ